MLYGAETIQRTRSDARVRLVLVPRDVSHAALTIGAGGGSAVPWTVAAVLVVIDLAIGGVGSSCGTSHEAWLVMTLAPAAEALEELNGDPEECRQAEGLPPDMTVAGFPLFGPL